MLAQTGDAGTPPSTWAAAPMRLSIASPPTMATTRCTTCCWWRRRGLAAAGLCELPALWRGVSPPSRRAPRDRDEHRRAHPGAGCALAERGADLPGGAGQGGPARDAGAAYRRRARLPGGEVPTRPSGWCSWYHYYANVSAADIRENLAVRAERFPALRYVQIDDGYQARMGTGSPLPPSSRRGGGPGRGDPRRRLRACALGRPLSPSPAPKCSSSTLTGS